MKKIIIAIILCLFVFGGVIVFLSIKYWSNTKIEEEILTVNKAYFYNENLALNIPIYSSSNESFILDTIGLESYLYDEEDNRFKVEIEEINRDSYAIYEEKIYYKYNMQIALKANNVKLIKTTLEINTQKNKIDIFIGNIYYYSSSGFDHISGLSDLYGLSFNKPFTSTGGIIIKLNKDLNIKKVYLPSGLSLGIEEVDVSGSKNNLISDYYNYDYQGHYQNLRSIEKDKYYILLLNYEEDILYDDFPIIMETGNKKYLLDGFCFMIINNLTLVKNLVKVHNFEEIYRS